MIDGPPPNPRESASIASRRRLLRWMAQTPLLAMSPALVGDALRAGAGQDRADIAGSRLAAEIDRLIANPAEAINVFDFEPVMRKNVPPAHYGFMASGMDADLTVRANRSGYDKLRLRPRRLVDVSKVDMSVTLFGTRHTSPIILAPVGGQKAYHSGGEEVVARAAKARDHLMILSTNTNVAPEEVIEARGGPIWCQLYATNKWDITRAFLQRAERAGCPVVVVTVDRAGSGNRETSFRLERTDTRDCSACHDRSTLKASLKHRVMYDGIDVSGLDNLNASALTWDSIKRIRDETKMRVLLKGILTREDAAMAAAAGVDGLVVSNHGGRAEDSGLGTIEALPEIVQEVRGRFPVLLDGGIRRGTDIAKALCLGASAVCIGRPYLWGLGAFGQTGVERVLTLLRTELHTTMQQIGAPDVSRLVPGMVGRIQ
jgi:4-hydroxymandelate oxidase